MIDKKLAQAMVKLQDNWDAKKVELAGMVNDGSLSPEDATLSLAGNDLKIREALTEQGFNPGIPQSDEQFEDFLKYARLSVDQLLPDYDGMIIGRHI